MKFAPAALVAALVAASPALAQPPAPVKLGNVVGANTVELITITQIEPIYVTFSVPEAEWLRT